MLTRSLLSGSEKSIADRSKSEGGSCDTAPVSKPYILYSAADAASAAIDYSKGNIEDGVVNSPYGGGPQRTPTCSPSPLKRASSGRRDSFTSIERTDASTSWKLDLRLQEACQHPRLEDTGLNYPHVKGTILSPSMLLVHVAEEKIASSLDSEAKTSLPDSLDHYLFPRFEDKPSRSAQSAGARRTLSADSLFRQRMFREHQRSLDSKSVGNQIPYIGNVVAPPRGSKSLSASASVRKTKQGDSVSMREGFSVAQNGKNWSHHYSQREDIFKGLAKLKALETTKSKCTGNTEA